MASYHNFFESTAEANMRLRGTIVLYDGEPYNVLCISDHNSDGIWRIYLDRLGGGERSLCRNFSPPPPYMAYSTEDPEVGVKMDEWLSKTDGKTGVIRKMMNSPKFNKFRPYPLGMCNYQGSIYYVERLPTRRSEQGLTPSMLSSSLINLALRSSKGSGLRSGITDLYGPEFYACITGRHPSAEECLTNLSDPDIINEAAAFHRQFAFVRGPLDMIFLAYKTDIIGTLPEKSLNLLRLGRGFRHTREVVELLQVFGTIIQD